MYSCTRPITNKLCPVFNEAARQVLEGGHYKQKARQVTLRNLLPAQTTPTSSECVQSMLPGLVLWQSTSLDSDPVHLRSSTRMSRLSLLPNDFTKAPERGRGGGGGGGGEEEEGVK